VAPAAAAFAAAPGEACDAEAPIAPRLQPGRDTFETAVEFARNPLEAARIAKAENKLLFVLHLSGDFDDPGFT
jgi:hypothetical protein